MASQRGDRAGTTDARYVPNVIAARAVGAAKPMVAETQPATNPTPGWYISERKLYSPPDRGSDAPSSA